MPRRTYKHLLISATLLALSVSVGLGTAVAGSEPAPRLDYQLIHEIDRAGASSLPTSTSARYGQELESLTRAAAVAGISAGEAANVIEQLPGNVPIVLGRYSSTSGDLAVEIYKVERRGTKTGVYRATFSPAHGRLWANARTYIDPALKHGLAAGTDPFERFAGANAAVFDDIAFDGVQVVMGYAMRYVSAPVSVLVATVPRSEQTMTATRSNMRKTVQITSKGYLQPKWYVAAPAQFQTAGSSAAICLEASGSCSAKPYLIAPSMVTFQEWQGGSMPGTEELVYTASGAESPTFAFDNFVAAAYVGTFAAGSIQSGMRRSGAADNSYTARLQQQGAPAGTPSAETAADAGQFYSGLDTVVEGDQFGQVQSSYRTTAGSGQFTAVAGSDGAFAQQFISTSEQKTIAADPTNTNGIAGIKAYYVGACAADQTLEQCAGTESGMIPRSDSYVELDASRFYQDTAPE